MSKIKNGALDQYGKVYTALTGSVVKGLKYLLTYLLFYRFRQLLLLQSRRYGAVTMTSMGHQLS